MNKPRSPVLRLNAELRNPEKNTERAKRLHSTGAATPADRAHGAPTPTAARIASSTLGLLRISACRRRLPGTRRNSSGDWQRKRVKSATTIATRSKQSDRSESECGTTAETARAASEEARGAAEAARQAVVDTVRATAETLNATFEQMKVVEEMRRTLREIRDVNKLVSNLAELPAPARYERWWQGSPIGPNEVFEIANLQSARGVSR